MNDSSLAFYIPVKRYMPSVLYRGIERSDSDLQFLWRLATQWCYGFLRRPGPAADPFRRILNDYLDTPPTSINSRSVVMDLDEYTITLTIAIGISNL